MIRRASIHACSALLLVVWVGCELPRGDVLATRDAGPPAPMVIRTCTEAFTLGRDGDRCDFSTPCRRELGPCAEIALCDVVLRVFEDCPTCTHDLECGPRNWCAAEGCVPCGEAEDAPDACPPCPFGWERPVRNGCFSCTQACLPRSECEVTSPESCGLPMGYCAPGRACGLGCLPEDPGCCANQCTSPDAPCMGETPIGCVAPCPMEPCESGLCYATECACDELSGGEWACRVECAGVEFAMSFAPPECFFDGPTLP